MKLLLKIDAVPTLCSSQPQAALALLLAILMYPVSSIGRMCDDLVYWHELTFFHVPDCVSFE